MKSICSHLLLAMVMFSLPLSGCGIYGYEMNGISGQAREKYLQSIKPYGTYWMKDGMTDAQRLDDIEQCGGGKGLYVGFPDAQIKAEREWDEATDLPARDRLFKTWSACMEANGYRY
jgi:hypothetical protein